MLDLALISLPIVGVDTMVSKIWVKENIIVSIYFFLAYLNIYFGYLILYFVVFHLFFPGFSHSTVNHANNFKDPETGTHSNTIEGSL